MAIRVVCPHCEAGFNVADELRGKKVRCRECEKPVPVVTARPRRADEDEEEREERVQAKSRKTAPAAPRRHDDEEEDDRPRRRKARYDDDDDEEGRPAASKKKKSSTTPLLIAGIGGGVAVLAGVIFLVIWLINRDKPENTQSGAPSGGPPAGFKGGGPPGGMMGGGPQAGMMGGGMMGGGPPGGMMGKGPGGGVIGDVAPAVNPAIAAGIQNARELNPEVRKKLEDSTVYFLVKDKEKNPTFAAAGSGFFAFEPGIVLTNAHVVDMKEPGSEEPESITVYLHKGTPEEKQLKAKVLGVDQSSDLAVVKVDPTGLPPPLVVKSSTGLRSSQPVYICGFPHVAGQPISTSVTILQGQVASLSRDEKLGVLKHVVLNSDMQHGNSGGPVVDDVGNVVGVSVAGYEGTRINFAVPGDYVNLIISGRVARMRTGQCVHSLGHIQLPITLELINPLDRIDKVEAEVWTGDDTPNYVPPPAWKNPPPPRAGDSEHKSVALSLHADKATGVLDKATGDLPLPELPPGKVYYWQPVVTYKDKEKSSLRQWTSGRKYDYEPDSAVHRRAANLIYKKDSSVRNVTVDIKEKFGVLGGEGEEHDLVVTFKGDFYERPGKPDAQGKSIMRIGVNKLDMDIKLPEKLMTDDKGNKPKRDREDIVSAETRRALEGAAHLDLSMQVNERGDIEKGIAIAKTAPQDIRDAVESMGDDILMWLQAVSVPLPNHQVSRQEEWKAKHPFAVLTPIGDIHLKDMEVTYTYLGKRTRKEREEALVDFVGRLRRKDRGLRFGGTLEGRALVDVETGIVTLARANVYMDLDLPFAHGKLTARGSMDVKIERTLR